MALKRPAEDQETPLPRHHRDGSKRTKLSSSAARSNSSEPSTCSVSEDSALQSTPPASTRERVSSLSSIQSADSTSDSGSIISSESDSDASESDSDAGIVLIGGPKKPDIRPVNDEGGHEDLRARIAAFLPQMEEANSLLASEGAGYNIEDVEDGEQHIEMNLGLGVLEEQNDDNDSEDDNSTEDSEEARGPVRDPDEALASGAGKRSHADGETRYMDRLVGRLSEGKKVGIEEIG